MQLSPDADDRFVLRAWNAIDIKPGIIDEGLITDRPKVIDALRELKDGAQGELTSNFVVACLPETKTFVKLFRIEKQIIPEAGDKKKKKKEKASEEEQLIQSIERELPKEIPLSLENILYDYEVTHETDVYWEVLVGAAPRDIVLEYTEILKSAGYYPMALEIEAQAISRVLIGNAESAGLHTKKRLSFSLPHIPFFKTRPIAQPQDQPQEDAAVDAQPTTEEHSDDVAPKKPLQQKPEKKQSGKDDPLYLFVDIGATRSSVIVYHHHTIQFTRSLQLSGDELTASIAEKMKLTPAKAEQAKKVCGLDPKKCKGQTIPITNAWLKKLATELRNTMDYYTNEHEGTISPFDAILLCGGGAALLQLPEQLTAELKTPTGVFDPVSILKPGKGIPELPQKSLPGYATVIGLAMRSI